MNFTLTSRSHASGPTYHELIRRGALQHGPRTAIVFGDQRLSFTEVDALSSRLAHALLGTGIVPRTRVGLLLNNGLYSVPLDFACVKAAINRVPLNSRLSLEEHVRMLQDTGCHTLVFGADLADRAVALAGVLPGLACLGLDAAVAGGRDLIVEAQRQPAIRRQFPAS
jgi:fatty-acyl-CoA synthase